MGRKSTGKYPANWDWIAEGVKDEAGWCCVRCWHDNEFSTGYVLTVHHLDLNKSNCAWWNLAALCQRCHLKIQGKVHMGQGWMFEHSDWFKPYVAGYYAHLAGLPEDREYVENHIEELLAGDLISGYNQKYA